MVRKRSRTSRKHYDSDDNDSDSDFSLEETRSQPAPKKYSLRQRKKALFIDDYDYEDDDEILPIPPTTAHSDDEDFDLENELVVNAANSEYEGNSTYSNHYTDPTEDPNGLIDFEDMIRADIVVNKNRIDYDNMIDKTEITIKPYEPAATPPVKSKRGRKPKKKPEIEIETNLLEPETEVQEDKTDKQYNSNEEHEKEEVQNFIEKRESQEDSPIVTEDKQLLIKDENELDNEGDQDSENTVQNDESDKTNTDMLQVDSQDSVIKFNEKCIEKSIHVNGTVMSTETSSLSEPTDAAGPNYIESDDDVVFVEDKRSEIIVLDD